MKIKNKVGLSALAILAGVALVAPGIRAAAPANDTEDITVSAIISDAISLTVSANSVILTPNLVPSSTADKVATGGLVATVYTNWPSGWELKIGDQDSDLGLKNNSSSFAAHSADVAGKTSFAASTDVWGYQVSTWGAGVYAGVKATGSDEIIAANTSAAPSGVATTINFAAQLAQNSSLPAGTYTDVIVLTAHAK